MEKESLAEELKALREILMKKNTFILNKLKKVEQEIKRVKNNKRNGPEDKAIPKKKSKTASKR